MPPDGYTTVTIPESLATTLDNLVDGSRQDAIKHLVATHESDTVTNQDLMNALQDVEAAAKEATSAAQSAERSVEELQR